MSDIARIQRGLPIEVYDVDGTWICPECGDDGMPDGCALCGAIDGSD